MKKIADATQNNDIRLIEAVMKREGEDHRRVARQLRAQCSERLRELPAMRARLHHQKQRLQSIEEGGLPMRQRLVQRFQRSGVRLTEEQIYQGVIKDMRAGIAAEEHALDELEAALAAIANDPYYSCVSRRYFDGWEDCAIGAELDCKSSTLRRHRVRLLDQMAVMLYGAGWMRWQRR